MIRLPAAFALSLLALTVATVLRYAAQPAPAHYFEHDQQVYLAMARTPFADTPQARAAPASWRILPPLLARVLGAGHAELGFFVLTFASFALIPVVTLAFLRHLGATPTSAMICSAVAAIAPPVVGYMSWDVVRVDPFALLLTVTAAAGVVTGRPLPLIIGVIALSMTKETVLLGAFFPVAWSILNNRRTLPLAVACGVTGVVIRWALLPYWLPPSPNEQFANLDGFDGVIEALSVRYVARRALLATSATWNVLLPLAVIWVVRERARSQTLVLLTTVGVALAQVLFASDTQRVVAAGYPFVLAMCAFELDRLPERWRRIVGATLLVGQLPWLLVYGRTIPEMPGIRSIEILIFIGSGFAALVTWRRAANGSLSLNA
jgi:hypothetical protein